MIVEIVGKRAAVAVLRDDVVGGLAFYNLVEFDDIRVVKLKQHGDFIEDYLLVQEQVVAKRDYLHCAFFVRFHANRLENYSKTTLTDFVKHLVLFVDVALLDLDEALLVQ